MSDNKDTGIKDFQLHPNKNCNRKKNRVGRGPASGNGKTCGKGEKGQKSRKGRKRPYVGFEGGQMPLARRLPKRGFTNIHAIPTGELKVELLNIFNDGELVNIETLKEKKLIRNIFQRVKIIAGGEFSKKLNINVYNVTKGAKTIIDNSGSTLVLSIDNKQEN
jgi:large subunit ribosomal protein L15